MTETEEREGKLIYREGKIEVRTFPNDSDAHSVWIGNEYFLFLRGCLEQFAERTHSENLEGALDNYNHRIPYVLKEKDVSPETFALVLARARIKELNEQVSDAYDKINSLEDRIVEK